MRPVAILTDSCSVLSPELLQKYNISYVMMNTVYNGVEAPASLAWEWRTPHAFYDIMRNGERITTTQVPVERFQKAFDDYLDRGFDVVYIACSSKQSGSVNTAAVLAKEYEKKNPEMQIYCIDSLNASLGEGMLAIHAATLRDKGLNAAEIAVEITKIRKNVNEFVTVHSLDALRRAGRVKGSAAFFGNLLGVKPIIISDAIGEQTPITKVKGRQKSFDELVNRLAEAIEAPETQTVYLAHADCDEEEIEALKEKLREKIPVKEIYVWYIGPIVGASIGPGAIGVFAFGKEVTYRV